MDRLNTGIAGLDDVLAGGLPTGQMYLLQGFPGTGKTTIAMQFTLAGLAAGEKALYVTLSEPRKELLASAESHGFDLDKVPLVEFVPDEAALSPDSQYTVFHPAEVELSDTINRLIVEIEKYSPDRLVLDSLSELRLLASDKIRYRRQLIALKLYLAERSTTVLLLDDCTTDADDVQLQSIVHGVIVLTRLPRTFGVIRRQIEVLKLRGSSFREGVHDYAIRRGGVVVYPRLVSSEHGAASPPQQIKSGIEQLDAILGGGLDGGTSVLITGPTGVGKSSISLQYAVSAAKRGDRAIVYCFDEVLHSAVRRAEGLGMDLKSVMKDGHLAMTQVDPAELSPGEFVWQIRKDVEEHGARFVVIDSLNGFLNAMPGERDLILQLHELFSYLAQKGVVTIIILTQHGLGASIETAIDVSYLADTVVLLRYFERGAEIHQAIAVLKKRLGWHERTLRELNFSSCGISVSEPLINFRGVLSGVPEFLGHSGGTEVEGQGE